MGVLADEEGTGDVLRSPVFDDGLCRGSNVQFVELRIEAGTSVPGSAENHLLVRIRRIGGEVVVRTQQRVDVDEIRFLGHLARAFMCHSVILWPFEEVGRD